MAPRISEQASRRTQLDSDDEPLATAVVAGSRVNSPGLPAFDLTVDDSDSNTVLDSAVVLATSHDAEDAHDQLSIEEGGHSTVLASPHLMESMSIPVPVHNRFAPLIEGGDVRASRRLVLESGHYSARDSDTDIQRESEVELAIDTPREEIGEPAMPMDLRRRRLVLVGAPPNEDVEWSTS